AATTDFSLSVRRAAARGLGMIKWHWFPDDLLGIAQAEALAALLLIAQQDEEWVVRYAAVVGLEALFRAITDTHLEWQLQIQSQFEQMAIHDASLTVRARVWLAQHHFQAETPPRSPELEDQSSPLSAMDWQMISEQLSARKKQALVELER
ncbi:MAG: HEAT repeat domain-containing protein, partial [Cyanothece sp. SIO1E1]|nr:HEAT repeat domain-containing protein [Cyanothece sp. SIO1E1]